MPNHYDFVLLYFKMIRLHVQTFRGPIQKDSLDFLIQTEYFAQELCKMILVDVELVNVRPSILAASAVLYGFKCSRQYTTYEKDKDLKHSAQVIRKAPISEQQQENSSLGPAGTPPRP
jgi:hypothetical protein